MLGILLCTLLAPSSPPSFYLTWSSRTDTPAKTGQSSSEADALARNLGQFIALELNAKYPCGTASTQSDTAALMDNERQRQLLGGDPSASTIASVAGAVGAKTGIHISVSQAGGKTTVNAVAVDTATARATARKAAAMPGTSPSVESIEEFARQFVGSLGDSVPRCPGKDWAGSVTVTYAVSGRDKDISDEGTGSLTCQVFGEGSRARCSYNSNDVMRGRGGSMTTTKTAKDADASVSVSLAGGTFNIHIGNLPVTVSRKGPGFDLPSSDEELTAEGFDLPAGPNPDSQSGTYSVPGLPIYKVTVSWNLSRAPTGKR